MLMNINQMWAALGTGVGICLLLVAAALVAWLLMRGAE